METKRGGYPKGPGIRIIEIISAIMSIYPYKFKNIPHSHTIFIIRLVIRCYQRQTRCIQIFVFFGNFSPHSSYSDNFPKIQVSK